MKNVVFWDTRTQFVPHRRHYFSATGPSRLMLCKIWGFHVGDYEECRLLGYKNPVRTTLETYYVSATGPSRLMLCKIWGFHGSDYEDVVSWEMIPRGSCKNRRFGRTIASIIRVKRSTLGVTNSFNLVDGDEMFFRNVGSSHTASHSRKGIFKHLCLQNRKN
jgi:hypothetical protein